MTQNPTPENQPDLPNPHLLGEIMPADGIESDLFNIVSEANAEQPEFVQRYAERRALGETAVDPLTLLELQSLEEDNGYTPGAHKRVPTKGKQKDFVYPRTVGDEFAESHVDYLDALDLWKIDDDKLKREASMRTKEFHKLYPGDHGEAETYDTELEKLRDNFGSPKPQKPIRHE